MGYNKYKASISRLAHQAAARPAILIITLGAIIFAAWMFCSRPSADSPGWHDDYAYACVVNKLAGPYNYFTISAKHIETLSETCQSIVNHYIYVNGRLANLLLYLLNYLPVWMMPLLHGAAYWLMAAGIMRLGAGPGYTRKALTAICVIWWIWIIFPWFDMSVCAAYIVNYVWSSALCLWSIYAMLDEQQQSRLRWLWLVIPAAMMHEGFSSLTGVGMLVWIIAHHRKYFSRPRLLILPAAFAIFSTFTLLSPGFQAIVSSRGSAAGEYIEDISTQLLKNWPIYLIIPIYIGWCIRHRRQNKNSLAYITMLLAGLIMMIFTKCTGRALWMTYLLITIAAVQMCSRATLRQSVRRPCIIILTTLLAIWGFYLCKYQLRYTREKCAAEREIRTYQDTRNYIFTPVSYNEDTPWWLFDVPEPSATNPKTNIRYMRLYETNRKGVNLNEPITLPQAADIPSAIAKMRQLPSGLRGDIHGIISPERIADKTLNFTFATSTDPRLPGWHPIYSLYQYPSDRADRAGQPNRAGQKEVRDGQPQQKENQPRQPHNNDVRNGQFTIPFKCEERRLLQAERDTLWYYFIPHTPKSLASHPLLNVTP